MTRTLRYALSIALGLAWALPVNAQAPYPRLRPSGRVQIDAAAYQDDRKEMSSGVEARRARIAVAGDLAPRWTFQVEGDFADDGILLKDAWLMYAVSSQLRLQAGHFKETFTLEGTTSSRYPTFLERSLADLFVPPRHFGLMARAQIPPLTATLGVFGQEAQDIGEPDLQDSEAYGFTTRITAAPVQSATRLLHIGAAGRRRTPDARTGGGDRVRFRGYSESHVDRTRFYDTGNITAVESFLQAGLEAAAVYGPWSIQAEHVTTIVRRAGSTDDPLLTGGYLYGSWLVTGESRLYDAANGVFVGVNPSRASGAIELAARYSTVDLNDAGVTGGAGHNLTVGANWYPSANIRVQLNYLITNHDARADANGEFAGDDDFRVALLRIQYHF